MPELKLAKLPDRTPVKITISVKPDLHAMLSRYAEFYRQSYGEEESVGELIPFMLQAFMEADRGFAKALKTFEDEERPASPSTKSVSNSESSR
ncbi:MAG: transposase [Rhodospirillales bacterium 69-11]|mgnify:CR=1 FL=1|jgi:hypothetical protein|nr:MAG: transposase [Rhodospirillales bacterium 69-11]